MVDFLVRLVINAIALLVAVTVVPRVRFEFGDEWWKLAAVAVIFGLINSYIRPIVAMLSLPLTIMTLGLVSLVINTAMVLLLAFLSGQLALGFRIAGWPPGDFGIDVILYAFLTALVISIVSTALGLVRRVVPGI